MSDQGDDIETYLRPDVMMSVLEPAGLVYFIHEVDISEIMTATVEVGDILQQDIINIRTLLSTLHQLLAVRLSELNNTERCKI